MSCTGWNTDGRWNVTPGVDRGVSGRRCRDTRRDGRAALAGNRFVVVELSAFSAVRTSAVLPVHRGGVFGTNRALKPPMLVVRIALLVLCAALAWVCSGCLQAGMVPRSGDIVRDTLELTAVVPLEANVPTSYLGESEPGEVDVDVGNWSRWARPFDMMAAVGLSKTDYLEFTGSLAITESAAGARLGVLSESRGAPLSVAVGAEGLLSLYAEGGNPLGGRARLDVSRQIGNWRILANAGVSHGLRNYSGEYSEQFARGVRAEGDFVETLRDARVEYVVGVGYRPVSLFVSGYRRLTEPTGVSCSGCSIDNDWGVTISIGLWTRASLGRRGPAAGPPGRHK